MPWYLHLYWGLVVYLSALQVGRGLAGAGEWLAKSLMKVSETWIAFQREVQARSRRGGP